MPRPKLSVLRIEDGSRGRLDLTGLTLSWNAVRFFGVAPSRHYQQVPPPRTRSFGLVMPLFFIDIVLSTEENCAAG